MSDTTKDVQARSTEDQLAGAMPSGPAAGVNSAMGMLGVVQGMMANMQQAAGGGGGALASGGGPGSLFQGAVTNPDGTTTTTVGADPSGSAQTSSAYDPTTNTYITTTVDPATGATTTTMTSAPITRPAGEPRQTAQVTDVTGEDQQEEGGEGQGRQQQA